MSLTRNIELSTIGLEIVVVDYNPPKFSTPLWAVVDDIAGRAFRGCSVVVATVPAEVHAALRFRPKWSPYEAQLFEYVAKNTGLRLASGRFTLVTNPDIIFGIEILSFLAAASLSDIAYYILPRSNLNSLPPKQIA